WSVQYPDFFLQAPVPYASVIEQMSLRRMPLASVVPLDTATNAFDTLWYKVVARLGKRASAATSEQKASAAFAKAILNLIAKLGGQADHDIVRDELPPGITSAPTSADERACTHRIRLEVHGEDAFESLGRELSTGATTDTTRLAHIFDTDDG